MRPEFEGEIRGILTLITTRVLQQKRFSSPELGIGMEVHNCFLSCAVRLDLSRLGRPVRVVLSWTALSCDDDSSFWTMMVVFSLSLSLFFFLSALCCGHTKKARVMSTFHPLFRERKRGIIIIIIKSSLRESPSSSSHTHSRRRKRRTVVLSLRRCSLVLSTRPLFDRCGQQKSADDFWVTTLLLFSLYNTLTRCYYYSSSTG